LRPLAELAPAELHPDVGRRYADLWQSYNEAAQALVRVNFEWHGVRISRAE